MKVDSAVIFSGPARVLALAVLTMLFGLASSATTLAQVRTWTDSTGKFSLQAKFVELADGKVKLEREDGSQFAIELHKLSPADQKYVAEQVAASPFQAVPSKGAKANASEAEQEQPKPRRRARQLAVEEEDYPAAPKRGTRKAEAEEEDEEEEEDAPKEVKPRWAGVEAVPLTPTKDKWSFRFTVPEEASFPSKLRAISLPAKTDFFERLQAVVANPVKGWAALGYTLDKHGKGSGSRLAICDLRKGKFLGAAWTTKAGLMCPLAMRDNGVEVVMRSDEFGHGNHDRLELWRMTSSGIKRLARWCPYDQLERGDRDVSWAAFVDADRLATMNSDGKLVLWSMETFQPICFVDTKASRCTPALSPDRKYIAFVGEENVGMFDVEAKEVAALTPTPTRIVFPICRFTPQGTRLVCGSPGRIYVWDMATGGLYREIWTDKIHVDNNMVCPSEDHVLAGNETLIDLESQIRLWTYSGHDRVAMVGNACLFLVSEHNRSGAVVPAVIPQPGVREALQKALANPEFFVLQPGTTVRVNVSGLADPGEREKAAATLTQKLSANGFGVGPNGTIELAASTESTKQIEVAYRSFGSFGHRIYKVQEYVSRLRFLYQGKVAWEGSRNNVPGMISLKEGQTVEQVLRESEKPNYKYFQQAELPRLLTNPNGSPTLGKSKVSAAGVQ